MTDSTCSTGLPEPVRSTYAAYLTHVHACEQCTDDPALCADGGRIRTAHKATLREWRIPPVCDHCSEPIRPDEAYDRFTVDSASVAVPDVVRHRRACAPDTRRTRRR